MKPVLNSARYMFLDERSRVFYPGWETTAREAVSGIRLLAGQDPTDKALMTYLAAPATPSAEAMNLLRSWIANEARTDNTACTSH